MPKNSSVGSQDKKIYISHLSLVNFRNYERLELDFQPGVVLLEGENGQGKSNLLEAIYLLSIAKSPRPSADRELIRRYPTEDEIYSRVSANVEREGDPLRVQIDFRSTPVAVVNEEAGQSTRRGSEGISVQKYFRVNGVPRRASTLVGQLNAVMFSAEDLELVHGSPTIRRRYLDILISQIDPQYLRGLQRYHRVVSQRNHLLRMVREGQASRNEMAFWDDELIKEGKYIMAQRLLTIRVLSEVAAPIHQELSGNGESLEISYDPNVTISEGESEEALAQDIRDAIESRRQREFAQGVTVSGPHRDDLQLLIDGMDVGTYASRGQARTVVLAMKLAEASYLKTHRQQEPILLLDDVLSELDSVRRAHILERASQYQQSFVTTADVNAIEPSFLSQMSRYVVQGGNAELMTASTKAEA